MHDDPILADGEVQYLGQPIFLVVAETVDQARRAARLAQVDYEDLPAILTIEAALAQGSFVIPTVTLERGDAKSAIAGAPHRLKGSLRIGGQEQFYLEGQSAWGASGAGVQLEISHGLRQKLFVPARNDGRRTKTRLIDDFVSSLRKALGARQELIRHRTPEREPMP